MQLATAFWLLAFPACASTIDLATAASANLHSGDALSVTFGMDSYLWNAALLGAPAPSALEFLFVTLPVAGAGEFHAQLESGGGDFAFPEAFHFEPGLFHGAAYDGAISAVHGTLDLGGLPLAPESPLVLTLHYTGSDIGLSLPPYTMRQVLWLTLSGGSLQVGVPLRGAVLASAAQTAVPEVPTGVLTLSGVLLAAIPASLLGIGRFCHLS